MDEVCSSQLLTSVRRMVLTLTQQNDESKEFVKFFHKQLGSILQVSSFQLVFMVPNCLNKIANYYILN